MNDLIKQNNNLIIRNVKVLKYDPKTETVIETRPVLLLDISGSMNECIGKKRKIDMLREAVMQNTGVRQFVFSDDIHEVGYVPETAEGGTDLSRSFGYLKTENIINKNTRLVLVSDGLPDDSDDAIQTALQLEIPVNVLYIGPGNDKGERFMKNLATITKGTELTVSTLNIDFQKKLTQGISALLYGGS